MSVTVLGILPFMIWINRARSNAKHILRRLPGWHLFWMCLAVFATISVGYGWKVAVVTATGYTIWASLGWEIWHEMNRQRGCKTINRMIWGMSFESNHIALFWRHFLLIMPYLVICSVWLGDPWIMLYSMSFAFSVMISYEIGVDIDTHSKIGDWVVGAIWWILVFMIFYPMMAGA